MVFESVLTYFLNKYLGPYVENLDTNQLNVGIWGGNVEFTDLILKRSALDSLDLPVQTVFGKIGKLALKIPWTNLYGAEFLITLEDIYLVVQPNAQVAYDALKEEKREYERKLQQLLAVENAKKLEAEKDKPKTDYTFVEKLSIQIVKNIRFSIKNIHIRYEDEITSPNPFAIGVTLGQLEVVSTDENWQKAISTADITKIFKILELESLSLYWNTKTTLYGDLSVPELCKKLPADIQSKNNNTNNKFILGPINAMARVKINQKPELDNFSEPSIQLNFDMQKLFVGVSRTQYYDIIALTDSMNIMSKGIPFRKYRPNVDSYKGHYKEWWHFAYTCVLESEVRRKKRNWDWDHMRQYRDLLREYKCLYLKKLDNKIEKAEQCTLEDCEKKIDVTNIVIIRNQCDLEYERVVKTKKKSGWLNWLWSSSSNEEPKSDIKEEIKSWMWWFAGYDSATTIKQPQNHSNELMKMMQEALTPEEKAKMYKAIGYQENAAPTIFPKDFIENSLVFILRTLEISLFDDSQDVVTRVLNTQLTGVKSKVETRPTGNGLKVSVQIDNFTTYGLPQEEDFIPQLISSDAKEQGLLKVDFEMNPLNSTCDQRIHIKAQPLRIVYDAQTIIKITDIFTVPSNDTIDEMAAAAGEKLTDVSQKTATGLQYAINKQIQLDLNLDFNAPYVIIPYGGKYTGSENVLVVNLGNIKMYSLPRKLDRLDVKQLHAQGNTQEEILASITENAYDQFNIELNNMQVVVAQSDEKWLEGIMSSTTTSMHLLNPVSLQVTLAKSLIQDDPRIPLHKFSGVLPSIQVNIADSRIMLLMSLVYSIPLPSSAAQETVPSLTRSLSRSSVNQLIQAAIQDPHEKVKEEVKESDVAQQFIKFLANFEMSELCITINRQETVQSPITQLAVFELKLLTIGLRQKMYTTEVSVSLDSVNLSQNRSGKVVQLVTNKTASSADALFKVNFIQASKKSPDFHTLYKSSEITLNLELGTLLVYVHQEAVTSLLHFTNDIQELMNDSNPEVKGLSKSSLTKSNTSLASSIRSLRDKTGGSLSKKKKVVDAIKFKLSASFNELKMMFGSDTGELFGCAIKGVQSQVIIKNTYTQVNAKLKELSVVDTNAFTVHSKIVQSLTQETMKIDLVMNNIEEGVEDERPNMLVHCSLGAIRIVFLNRFVSTVLGFLNNFQNARQSIITVSQAAAQNAKENMKSAYESAVKISLEVNLKAPIILVPVDSKSFEVLYIDLGEIALTNKFTVLAEKNSVGNPAVIDELSAKLSNLKISTVVLNLEREVGSETTVLKPLTTTVMVKRNLSTSWFRGVPDIDITVQIKTIEVVLHDTSYNKIMGVLNGNLAEGDAQPQPHSPTISNTAANELISEQQIAVVHNKDEEIHEFLKFTFAMNTLDVKLLQEQFMHNTTNPTRSRFSSFVENALNESQQSNTGGTQGLAQFTLKGLSSKGRIMTDGSIVASVLLVDYLLTDIRPGRDGKLNRLIERTPIPYGSQESLTGRSMIDLTFQKKDLDTFVDLRVYSITLILSMDYLMKLAAFFKPPVDEPESTTKIQKSQAATSVHKLAQAQQPPNLANKQQMTINLKIEKPDIILIEKTDDINTKAIVLNNEVLLKYRIHDEHQVVNGSISNLQMYICTYNPELRDASKKNILHPLTISLAGSTPEDKGLHLELIVTDVHLSVSPAIIELLSKVISTATAKEEITPEVGEVLVNLNTIWEEQCYEDNEPWYLKTADAASEVTEDFQLLKKKCLDEMCIVSVSSVSITLEAGVGNQTLPMIMVETSLRGCVRNWSSQMVMEASLTLEVGYYNSKLALWEPLVEPVTEFDSAGQLSYVPWELKVEMAINEQEDVLSGTSSDDINREDKSSVVDIDVISENRLEITVTKTCLEVLTNLGNAFANALKVDLEHKEDDRTDASYKVVNETGLTLTLNLKEGPFAMYNEGRSVIDLETVVLEGTASVFLQLKGEQRLMSTVRLREQFSQALAPEDYILEVEVNDKNTVLSLPVLRSEMRYFPLIYKGDTNDNWGIISHVTLENGLTVITLRSIIQVYNHFRQPIEVYHMTDKGNELKFISSVPAEGHINVPVPAVYTQTNELFFAVPNFSVSTTPYVWKDLQNNLVVTKLLQCPPRSPESGSQNYIIKAMGEMQQVYMESTNKHTMVSNCYNIHLRPVIEFTNCLPVDIILNLESRSDEYEIKAGHTWNLRFAIPGKSALIIRIPNYLEKEWVCRNEILEVQEEFAVWTFTSHDSQKSMSIALGVHCINTSGSEIMQLYCPFWMLNKTGVSLGYIQNEETNCIHHPPDFKGPIMFSFNAKNFFGKKKASICVDQGKWSKKFSLDVAGSSGTVICEANDQTYQIGVHNQLTYNGLTKQITFTPYYVILNQANYAIDCQEFDRPADPWITVEAKSCAAFWPRSDKEDKCMRVRVHGTEEVTAHFLYTESHTTLLKLKNMYGGISVDVQLTEGAVYVNFASCEEGIAPALIVNDTSDTIEVWEKEHVQKWNIPPKHCQLYTWENPSGPRKLVWLKSPKKEYEDDLRKDGLGEITLEDESLIYWASFLDGMQRVLLFTGDKTIAEQAQSSSMMELIQQDINVQIQGIGVSLVNNTIRQEILYVAIASSGIIWETCKLKSKRFKPLSSKDSEHIEEAYQLYQNRVMAGDKPPHRVSVDGKTEIDFETMEYYKPGKRNIRRCYQTGLWLNLKTSPNQMQLHIKVNRIQIDNQMFDCLFPVILAPVPPPKSVAAINDCMKPFIEVSIVQLLMKNSQIKQYKYFKVLVQEFHIKVEMGLINALLGLFEQKPKTYEEERDLFLKDVNLVNENLYSHAAEMSLKEQKNFYDLLHFSPLKVHVSFSLGGGESQMSETNNFINVLLQGVGVTLTDMNDVVFKLAYFERDYMFLTRNQLISETTTHYVGQTIKQLYVLILGLDVLGNPYGLVLGITKGVEDLFYEPFQGAIQGPGEFAEGLVLGVRSLFGHTVGGAAGAVSKITGAMGKGLAALTFDKDYQRKRRDQLNKKAGNVQEHFARGGKGLVMGVFDGVTGVFTKPVTGAKEEGVEGFFKGLGKGAIGLVARPTAGIVDFASTSFDVVKRATDSSEEVTRLRQPRFISENSLVKPYNTKDARGQKLLVELEKGKFAVTDIYVYFHEINKKEVVLLTDKRLAYINYVDVFGTWQIDWSFTWDELKNPAKIVPKGITITVSGSKKKLFKSNETSRLIAVSDARSQNELYTKIEELRGA
ncbi:intermembrane lipid transfer protein Vps13-like isoform X2 [Aethina tumida]|uniref:intermembrane lipid transfer protein Vps13-like isoform X2 n=1 Tax=Aethina tumida TaxID=116153 RepID=UPI0021490692|nr:intermembrane lipid transfer protein Vps13-like isoform X2 [Aethina tumida]